MQARRMSHSVDNQFLIWLVLGNLFLCLMVEPNALPYLAVFWVALYLMCLPHYFIKKLYEKKTIVSTPSQSAT